jgi:hypothetical protein
MPRRCAPTPGRETERKYRETHPEAIRERDKSWQARNPERKRQNHRNYYHRNKSSINAKRRADYQENPYPARQLAMRYRDLNPDRVRIVRLRQKTLRRNLTHTLTADEWQRALNYFGGQCAVCGRIPDMWTTLAVDHWIPASNPRPDNPGTTAGNVIPLCHSRSGVPAGKSSCNNSKSNKDPAEWLVQKFGKRKAQSILKRIETYFDWVREQDGSP